MPAAENMQLSLRVGVVKQSYYGVSVQTVDRSILLQLHDGAPNIAAIHNQLIGPVLFGDGPKQQNKTGKEKAGTQGKKDGAHDDSFSIFR